MAVRYCALSEEDRELPRGSPRSLYAPGDRVPFKSYLRIRCL